MSDHINEGAIKVIEIIGVSQENFDDAIQKGVSKAADSVKGITGLEVMRQTAKVRDGRPTEFRVALKLAFAVQ